MPGLSSVSNLLGYAFFKFWSGQFKNQSALEKDLRPGYQEILLRRVIALKIEAAKVFSFL